MVDNKEVRLLVFPFKLGQALNYKWCAYPTGPVQLREPALAAGVPDRLPHCPPAAGAGRD